MKGQADEDRDGGFDQGGRVLPYVDEVVERFMSEATAGAGALLLGRRSEMGELHAPRCRSVAEIRRIRAASGSETVVLGSGKRLFADGRAPRRLKLTATRPTPSGVLITTYHRSAEG
ncbi:hypothetical protein [Streptomyces anulatus]|uniref:hypothetical protein n=1 Tax=Streptomyces anulatus TaxID=1892 RepID=UPI0033FC29D7